MKQYNHPRQKAWDESLVLIYLSGRSRRLVCIGMHRLGLEFSLTNHKLLMQNDYSIYLEAHLELLLSSAYK